MSDTPASWAAPVRLVVRPPSAAFSRALCAHPTALDPAAAASQHAGYVSALTELGLDVTVLPPSPYPDGCFVEDPVVVLGPEVVRTRSAVASRQGEATGLLEALGLPITDLPTSCTLDGGDVLRIRDRLLVGRSSRTSESAILWLTERAERWGLTVHGIEVPSGLHLKSACSLAGPDLLVVDPSVVSPEALDVSRVRVLPVPESVGANVLALGGVTLVSTRAPRTAALLSKHRTVRSIDVSAFHAADGALTCLSVRLPAAGGWVT